MMQQVLVEIFTNAVRPCVFGSGDRNELIEKLTTPAAKIITYLGSKNFLQGDEVRFTDFLLFELTEMINAACEDDRFMTANPTAAAHHARMLALPTFGAYWNSDKALKAPFFPP